MDNPKSAADRIRPILEAMERSIDSARSRRTNVPVSSRQNQQSSASSSPAASAPSPAAMSNKPPMRTLSAPDAPPPNPNAEPRLKAKPKRANINPGFKTNGNGDHRDTPPAGYRSYIW